jgi:hypothetical protein
MVGVSPYRNDPDNFVTFPALVPSNNVPIEPDMYRPELGFWAMQYRYLAMQTESEQEADAIDSLISIFRFFLFFS